LLLGLLKTVGPNEQVVLRALRQLGRCRRFDDERRVILENRGALSESPAFLKAYAEFTLQQNDPQLANDLLGPALLSRLADKDPLSAARLLIAANREEEAGQLRELALISALRESSYERLLDVGRLFVDTGESERFRRALDSADLPQDMKDAILERVMGRRTRSMLR